MLRKRTISCIVLCFAVPLLVPMRTGAEEASAERGRDFVLHRPLVPPVWSSSAYENAWKQWGLKEKPDDYDRKARERYGLVEAPFDNHGLPLGLVQAPFFLGQGVTNNCLLCHAGRIAGQTFIGLGNASMDLQSIFEDFSAGQGFKLAVPFGFSYVRGTIDPVSPVAYLMQVRDAELNLRRPVALDMFDNLCSDPPAWWLLKKKTTRDWTGGITADSTRIDMANLLTPLNSAARIKEQEGTFKDIHAFLLSIQPPVYPFPVDSSLAARGRHLFAERCMKCHGTYGPGGSYPNKIVSLGVIGTDRTLAEAISQRNLEFFNQSWFAQQIGKDGKPIRVVEHRGYQAPPLDGIWATAPYFHNGSTPTVYHVLNSRARPKVFTRSYRTEKEDYDSVKLGWKIRALDQPPDSTVPANERRRIYDTQQPGRGNGGHTFGDDFTEDERHAVIEYLKTL
jgi:processive rubber oxygenase RoxA-like protein